MCSIGGFLRKRTKCYHPAAGRKDPGRISSKPRGICIAYVNGNGNNFLERNKKRTSWCQKAGMYSTSPSCRVTRYGRHRFNLAGAARVGWRHNIIRTPVPVLTFLPTLSANAAYLSRSWPGTSATREARVSFFARPLHKIKLPIR